MPLRREIAMKLGAAEYVAKPFDLARGPLFRVPVIRAGADDDHLLGLVLHHVVTDGWSTEILLRDLGLLYRAYGGGDGFEGAGLAPLPIDYADYAAWEREHLDLGPDLAFWREHLRGASSSLELPTDHPRPAVRGQRGASVHFELPKDAVRGLARDSGVTSVVVLLAAFQVFLSQQTGQTDLVVGMPIANRGRAEIEGVVGFFVNTLALRTRLERARSFWTAVRAAHATTLDALAHQELPFDRLVEAIAPPRDTSRTPIFQVMFSHVEAATIPELPGLDVTVEADSLETSKFDLLLLVEDQPDRLSATFEYDVALFDRTTVERFADRLAVLVDAAARTPDAPLANLPTMSEAERRRVVREWNPVSPNAAPEGSLWDRFAAQAERTPAAVAIEDATTRWTYAELRAPGGSSSTRSPPESGSRSRSAAPSTWSLPCSACSAREPRTSRSIRSSRSIGATTCARMPGAGSS